MKRTDKTLDKLDNIIRDSLSKKLQQQNSTLVVKKQLTLEDVIRESLNRELSEQYLTAREVDSLEKLTAPTAPGSTTSIFPGRMDPDSFLTKTEKEIDNLVATKKLKPWPSKYAAVENIFKSVVTRKDALSVNNAGRIPTATTNSYKWQVPVYATDMKSGTLFVFQPDGLVFMQPDLSISTKFNWKLSGNQIQISNPGGAVFGYITKRGKYLVFDLTNDVKSGEFDRYKESGIIQKFFLVAGHGVGAKNLYKRQAAGFEDLSNQPIEQIKDTVQTILDWAGLIPGYGDAIDLVNAIWYFSRGRKLEGTLSLIAIIPWAGSLAKLSWKQMVARVRFGGRVGLEAIQAAMKSEQEFIKLWQQNARQRQSVKTFLKEFKKLASIKNIKQMLLNVVKAFKGQAPALEPFAEELVKRYGDDIQEYMVKTAIKAERFVKIAEEGADELFLASSVIVKNPETKKAVLHATSKFFATAAKSGVGSQIATRLIAMLPKKTWDSIATNMASSFIALGKKNPQVFVSSILNTTSGRKYLQDIFISNKQSIITWVKNANLKLGDYAIPKTRYAFGQAGMTDDQIWNAIMNYVSKGNGESLYKNIFVPLFATTKQMGDTIVGKLSPDKWISEILQKTINDGNIIFIEYTKSFWNRLYSYAPTRIYKAADVGQMFGKIVPWKYDWRGGQSILDAAYQPIATYLDKNAPIWTRWVLKPLNTLAYSIVRAISNTKRLDILYNEFQDLLEKAGVYTDDKDQRQGFFVSLISWALSISDPRYINNMYKEHVKPSVDVVSDVYSQIGPNIKSDPTDYDFVIPAEKKGEKPKVQFKTPTASGLTKSK